MPINTSYNPQKVSEFAKDNLQFFGQSIYFTCDSGQLQNGDLVLTEDYLLTGGTLLVYNGNIEDKISMQIVHPILGVLNEFVKDYRVTSDSVRQIVLDLAYPAKVPAGLIIRCKFEASIEGTTRKIAANLFTHKVMY